MTAAAPADTMATISTPLVPRPPGALCLDPNLLVADLQGARRTHWHASWPRWATKDDLLSWSFWKKCQTAPGKQMRANDLLFVDADGWSAECTVRDAGSDGVTIHPDKIWAKDSGKSSGLFADGTFAVRWEPEGFFVERLADGVKMTPYQSTSQIAERDLRGLYPKRA